VELDARPTIIHAQMARAEIPADDNLLHDLIGLAHGSCVSWMRRAVKKLDMKKARQGGWRAFRHVGRRWGFRGRRSLCRMEA
jgi:hypothetical protein